MFRWIKKLFSKLDYKDESLNVVASIGKAKSLYKELIVKAHPDKHPNQLELATTLTELINKKTCKVSITSGNQSFRHEMSTVFFRSGFRISVENDSNIRDSELRDISQYILTNAAFVRQLMSLGFDTLVVSGKTTGKNFMYSLKQYTTLTNFFID